MHAIKEIGWHQEYNFEKDEKLDAIVLGTFGDCTQADLNEKILFQDSLMIFWLLTVPEKMCFSLY